MTRWTRTDSLQSWGKIGRPLQYRLDAAHDRDMIAGIERARSDGLSLLGVGLGRSYGDSGQNHGQAIIRTPKLDRVLAFDAENGVLRAQAGLSLSDAINLILPFGWFLPTTPGSKFVTIGGAVANDVHGKNHYSAGTFGSSVTALGLMRSDVGLIEVSPLVEPELFAATIGGLGLTGLILWVEVKLAKIGSAFLDEETCAFENLDGYFALAEESAGRFEHTVSWIDCSTKGTKLGRGLFTRGNWCSDGRYEGHSDRPRLTLPFDAPNWGMNPLTLRLFNAAWFGGGKLKQSSRTTHYATSFYPLDAIGKWNRLYGSRGFYQYQCVVPTDGSRDTIGALLSLIAASGQGSFLAVLKTFGHKVSPGLLSFPMPGVTLALDFPNCGDASLALFKRLDVIVAESCGRLYPAKDARMSPSMFRQGYQHTLNQFIGQCDPALSSSFWRRVYNG